MDKTRQSFFCSGLSVLAAAGATLAPLSAQADNFGRVYYDKNADMLVVTMIYRGTNPNHQFSLKWGDCRTEPSSGAASAVAEVLDDQFSDGAQMNFKKTARFSLAGLPCTRPASVTLRTAPRFIYTLIIPG
jgi:hypothetical protein